MDGDADHEDGADAEPSLAAPENTAGSQVVYMRGGDQDREAETPETVLPKVPIKQCLDPLWFMSNPYGGAATATY